ncbi:hypothetical protein TrVGV298_004401 [Trichoderma virens]|nr:hypothetical protein TrVGV298_004401 [Trichoderma virens]
MASRLKIWGACRTLAVRPQSTRLAAQPFRAQISSTRFYADDATSKPSNPPSGAKKEASGSTSKSEPRSSKATESSSGKLAQKASEETTSSSQASPIEALDDATLEQILYGGRPVTSQREGGLTEAQEEALYREGVIPPPEQAEAVVAAGSQSIVPVGTEVQNAGHKFGLPQKPYPDGFHVKKRYHPVLEQITRLLMRHGELSVAQRRPPPSTARNSPLLPGTPPAAHLPLNPVLYITIAIDSVAPLLKVRNIAGAGGGGRALELPVPPRAEEIIAVVEGRSSVWEKRKLVHKLGTAARANVGSNKLKTKKKK